MRKTILVGAALLASAAPATAHNAGLTIDCDQATIGYSQFPWWMDSTITWDITVNGQTHVTGSRVVRRTGAINIPLAITGTKDVVFNVSWVSDLNDRRVLRDTLVCPEPTPPVIDPPPPPAPTDPPPVITTPVVTPPPVPTPPKPVKPKPLNCVQLKAAGAGINWLRKRGCVKTSTTVVKACPPGKHRKYLRVVGPDGKARIYTRCVSLVPAVTG